ncbi:hypothetical protein WJX74_005983 [Apatococcus lobatus]|uniref:Uncharacterized protein n=1 Tax=Apatococcus lobatus TaxID=904363 RepID=A0AAW1S316_9CHLO
MGSALEPADGLASDTGRSSGLRPSAPTFVPGKGLKGLPALSTSRRDSPRSPWRRKFEVPFTPSQGICTPQSSMSIYSNGPGWPQMSQVPFDPYRGYFYPTYMVQSAQVAQIAFGSFSPNSPDLIAAPRSSQPFTMPGLRRQSSEPSMHSIQSTHRLHPGVMSNGSPAYHQPLPNGTSPSAMHMQPDFHQWSPFVGHMPMTPGTFNAIQRGEFCAPGWSQNCSPSGSGIHVPVTPPTTPSTPVSAQGWKVLRPGLNVHVPPAGPWHEQSPQGAPNEGGPAMGAHGLVHQRSRLGKQVSVGTHLEPIADGAESSTHGDEGSESIEGRSPTAQSTPSPSKPHAHLTCSNLQRRPQQSSEPAPAHPYVPMSEQEIHDMLAEGGSVPPAAVVDLALLMQNWGLAPSLDPEFLSCLKASTGQGASVSSPDSTSGSSHSCHNSPPGNKEMHATAGFKVVASRSHGRRGGQPAVPLNARQRRTLKRAQERAQAAMASFDKTPPAVTK